MRIRTCEICGKRMARYVCQECGREVCHFCIEQNKWVCLDCYYSFKQETPILEVFPWLTPFKLFLFGFLLILTGTIFARARILSGALSIGAIIFLGPIPIILRAGSHLIWAIILAFALTILGLLFLLHYENGQDKTIG